MRKTLNLFFIISALVVSVGLLGSEAWAEKKIGILLWSEAGHYVEAKNGLVEQLSKDGFGDTKVKITIENANGNKARAAEIAQKFSAAGLDIVVPIGTSAAAAVAKEIKETPVVFSMVYDPIEAKIADSWNSSGNNTTGSSSMVSMSQLVGALKQLAHVKILAVLYTPGEKNSESQLKDIMEVKDQHQIRVLAVPLTTKEEVPLIVGDVAGKVDAIYLSGSSIVGSTLATIVEVATKAKVITVSHLGETVEKGVLLGVFGNPTALGRLAGEKAVKVFKGAKPAAIPIESLKKPDIVVNLKTAKTGRIEVPQSFLKTATRVIE